MHKIAFLWLNLQIFSLICQSECFTNDIYVQKYHYNKLQSYAEFVPSRYVKI